MTFIRRFKFWLPVIAGMIVIYWMSTDAFSAKNTARFIDPVIRFFAPSLTRKQVHTVHFVIRKTAHVTEYLMLGILLFRAFRAGSPERKWLRWACSSLAVVALYALTDEFHQSFLPVRTASIIDVGYDTLGGLLAQGISIVWYRRPRPEHPDREPPA